MLPVMLMLSQLSNPGIKSYLYNMKIRLYIYEQSIAWAQLEVLGKKHLTADTRDYRKHNTNPSLELCTSNTTSKDPEPYIAMCERDVNQGYARAIDVEVEPLEIHWNENGLSYTVIPFDFNLLLDPIEQPSIQTQ